MTPARGSGESWLAVIRIAVGLWFLKAAFTKLGLWWVFGWLPLPGANQRFLGFQPKRVAEWAASPEVFGWYRAFLESVVLPNAVLFAHLQALGETVAGLGLVLGLFTQVSAGLALFLTLNYALATIHVGFCQQGFHFLLIVCLVALLFGDAGRRFGLDGRRKGYYRPAVSLG
jgi:thiosulfate dehydrogenase [quinone] large subunit